MSVCNAMIIEGFFFSFAVVVLVVVATKKTALAANSGCRNIVNALSRAEATRMRTLFVFYVCLWHVAWYEWIETI